jgi:hypothetical protein
MAINKVALKATARAESELTVGQTAACYRRRYRRHDQPP